jgi:cytochrome c-type biogenesis protein CcmH/NrfG/O-antigen ligase
VSSLAGRRRAYVPARRGWHGRLPLRHVELPDAGPFVTAGVAAAIVLSAFGAGGGSQLERTTYTAVALTLTGALLCALAAALPRPARTPPRLRGIWVLVSFFALAAFTALSIMWSLMPADSWFEANRTLAYAAVLAGAWALGRLAPRRWSAVIAGVALGSVLLGAASLLTKVFPAWLAPDAEFARLRPPFEYWNSVGLAAALGVVPLLWLAARRSGHQAINAIAWPALGLSVVCLLFSYSRGALLAAAIGVALWLIFVPLRLRALITIGGVLVATIPVVVWAFVQDGLADDGAPMPLRVDAGQGFGALLLLLVVALTVAGLAVGFLSDVHTPSSRVRARASRVLVGALAVVPAVAILMLANAPGGIDGQVSKAWKQATDPAISGPSNSPQRLTATSSGRARYWREAMKVHAQAPWLGTGAGSYGTTRLRYRVDARAVQHAHGYVVQTLADLGWVGLGLSLLAALTWLTAAVRGVGLWRRDLRAPWDAERVGLATLAAVAVIFGLHSAIDWTWFVPGNVVPALLCAGWVASRGSLRERRQPAEAAEAAEARLNPFGLVTAGLVLVIALVAAWGALQPVRSVNAQDAALERLDLGAVDAAASIAQIAHERNPLSIDPLFQLAAIREAQGRTDDARRALEQAVDLEPANPETWHRLGEFQLDTLNDPKSALRAFQAALYLDPKPQSRLSDVVYASRIAAGG